MSFIQMLQLAKSYVPEQYEIAHQWLDDMQHTHHKVQHPEQALQFFMLGLFAGEIITVADLESFNEFFNKQNCALH